MIMLLHNQEIDNLRKLQEDLENGHKNALCEFLNRRIEQSIREENAKIALQRGPENDIEQSFGRGK